MRKGEYFSVHLPYILPRDAYQQPALKEHQLWNADHGDQRGDHCLVPNINRKSQNSYNLQKTTNIS